MKMQAFRVHVIAALVVHVVVIVIVNNVVVIVVSTLCNCDIFVSVATSLLAHGRHWWCYWCSSLCLLGNLAQLHHLCHVRFWLLIGSACLSETGHFTYTCTGAW